MLGLFFSGNLDPVPGIGLIFIVGSTLAGFIAYRLYRARMRMDPGERARAVALADLQWYFTVLCIFWLVDIFPHVLLIIAGVSVSVLTTTHWAAHVFLFITVVLTVRIATSFLNPAWKTRATILTGILMVSALAFSAVRPDHLDYIPGSVYPLISADPYFSHFYTFASTVSAGFFGLYLVLRGLAALNSLGIRMVLMGLGFISQVAIGVVIAYVHVWYTPALIYTLIICWVMFPGMSALMSVSKK